MIDQDRPEKRREQDREKMKELRDKERLDEIVDEALKETFPASDPPGY